MSVQAEARPLTRAEKCSATMQAKNAILVEEILFLLDCNIGEAGILEAIGYSRSKDALKRRLLRLNRPDLSARIFEADQLYHHREATREATT